MQDNNNNNNVLSKFQLESAPEYYPTIIYDEDDYYDFGVCFRSQVKQVRDVMDIKTPTEFVVRAEIVELKYYIYEVNLIKLNEIIFLF